MRTTMESTGPPGADPPRGESPAEGGAPLDAFTTVTIAGVEVSSDNVVALVHAGVLDVDGLSACERDTALQLCELARRRADAAVTLIVDSADRTGSYGADGHASVRGWGKALCRWSKHDASTQAMLMRLLRDHPRTAAEYLAGRLGHAQAVLLAKLATHRRAGPHYPGPEELLVEDAQTLDYDGFRTVTNRWLTLADPDGADQDEALKHYCRNGCVISSDDGRVHLDAQFAAAQGATISGQVRRVVTEGASTVIDLGRRRRLFTGSARIAVQLQHPRCTYPGCGLPVRVCQIDHVRSWHDNGQTAPWNGQPHCPRHNRWKESGYHTWQSADARWHTQRPDGTIVQAV